MNRTPMKRTAWPRFSTTVKSSRNREKRQPPSALVAIKTDEVCDSVQTGQKVPPSSTVRARIATLFVAGVVPSAPTVSTTSGPRPKTKAQRNSHLRELARGMPCLLRIRGVCNGDWSTTVACHSNLSIHGKAGARKADDHYTVWGCAACHSWLDQGRADGVLKETAFMAAHLAQVLEWRAIAVDGRQTTRNHAAVRWALELLSSTPFPSLAHSR